MPIQFQCPHCQHAMQLPDTAAGKQGKCPKCSNAVTVPAVRAAAPLNPHDEEFWSEVGEKKESVSDEPEEPKHVKTSDAQLLKKMLGKAEAAKVVKRIGMPWERPREGSMFERYWDTAIGVMNNPTETFAEMRVTGGMGSPLRFLLLGAMLGALIAAVYVAAIIAIVGASGSGAMTEAAAEGGADAATASTAVTIGMIIVMVIAFFGTFLGSPIVAIIHVYLQAAGLQIALPIVGVKQSVFEKNFRVTAFTNGSIFLCNIVPVLGSAFMLFMWFNGMIKGLESVYELSNNKAASAVLLLFVPLVLPIVAVVGFFALTMLGYI